MVRCLCFNLFFFSSRRRHTRSLCDWSSDVCSSDLKSAPNLIKNDPENSHRESPADEPAKPKTLNRSEERRVGKECRYRWAPDHSKKKNETYSAHVAVHYDYEANVRGTT